VFDTSVLGAMFGDESAIIASVLQTFVTGTRASLSELTQAANAQDLAAVASLAHKITGASRLSGAMALGQTAHTVEQAAKQQDSALVGQLLATLDTQWRLLESTLLAQT
jgi:HPt (histidine-containing phosphotransfer) domain-containing protein